PERHVERLWSLCDEFNRKYELGSCRSRVEFDSLWGSLSQERQLGVLAARERDGIQATLSCFDASEVKQNVVVKMSKALRSGVAVLRAVNRFLPFFRPPTVGETVRNLYLRNVAVHRDHDEALKLLVQHARYLAFQNRYSFVTIGLHERDPLRSIFRMIPKYTVV